MKPQENTDTPTPQQPAPARERIVIQPQDEAGLRDEMATAPANPAIPASTQDQHIVTPPQAKDDLGERTFVRPSKRWRNFQLIMYPVALLTVGLPLFLTYALIFPYPQPIAELAGTMLLSLVGLAFTNPELLNVFGALGIAGLIALGINVISYPFFLKQKPRKKSYVIGGSILLVISVVFLILHFSTGIFTELRLNYLQDIAI